MPLFQHNSANGFLDGTDLLLELLPKI
jgi:hypothetical protein